MAKKSARELRSLRRHRIRTRSFSQKGITTNRVLKQETTPFISQLEQTAMDNIPLSYTHIECNEYINRGHKQLLEDDIPVCSCKVVKGDPESACGDHCLNFITSNECTPGFCPCGELCRNQRFQQKKYAKTKLVKTNERGWGLLADQDIKMGEFIMEYCGEVISSTEARARSQAYQLEGMEDSYIISLSGSEFIDATKKGSLGRFINHSCEPNCETRKWTVLGEVRVGIFAKQNIDCGTELTYNYNFEWYGGAKIRCLCGAASCVGFLGAKSRGFQADSYVWDDNDERYSVENIPLYDSDDDEPLVSFFKRAQVCNKLKKPGPKAVLDGMPSQPKLEDAGTEAGQNEEQLDVLAGRLQEEADCQDNITIEQKSEENKGDINTSIKIEPVDIDEERPVRDTKSEDTEKTNSEDKERTKSEDEEKMLSEDREKTKSENKENKKKRRAVPALDVRKRLVRRKSGISQKKSKENSNAYSFSLADNRLKIETVYRFLPCEAAREDLQNAEEHEAEAVLELKKLNEELRPVMEDLGKDGSDSLPIGKAEEWITAMCKQLTATFDFNYLVIKKLSSVH